MEFATRLNKLLAPIVCRLVADNTLPESLARISPIDFVGAPLGSMVRRLVRALYTDIEWIRKHTEFGEGAERWHAAERPGPDGLMLRPPLLGEAERWIAAYPEGAPKPTERIRAFIATSREALDQEMERLKQELVTRYEAPGPGFLFIFRSGGTPIKASDCDGPYAGQGYRLAQRWRILPGKLSP